MFDSLKDKLGSFRDDVEETAEEKAEDADAEPADDADAETDGVTADEADTAERPESEAAVADAESPETATATGAEPADERGVADDPAVDDEAAGSEAGAGDADADSDAADDDGGTGFARKAKAAATGKFVIEEEDLEDPLWELEMALLESDVEMSVAEEILDTLREELVGETRGFTQSTGSVVEDALREALLEVISVGQFDFDERVAAADKPLVIIFTGVNGVGKTTTIAKLSRYLEQRGYSSVLANGDTYRAGANEQIQKHADALDRKLISHQQGGDPAAVIYDAVEYAEANDVDVVLGDTAGRLHTDEGLMDQLEKIGRVVGPDMTLFVDEAVAGQDAVQRAKQFDEAATIDGSVLTKADADPQGGAAISIAHVTGKPILFLGTGQEYDDIERFDPDEMVERLLG
ncbi:signal recognition particle-docking protein FtsY [Halostella salina]|uniref:signal recognition particle-docking protein FtsY n=1 Tax=Halostella salina TaxID=1547897 RepID=UPI000EF7EE82|nr:signal recognition particle-docking protein FtsY [Halostella salina]